VAENQSLAEGEQLTVLAAGIAPTEIRVGGVKRPAEAPNCARTSAADPPSKVAPLTLPASFEFQ